MQSLIDRANKGYSPSLEKKQHWKYDWYTPSHSDTTTSAANSSIEETQIADSNSIKRYPFQYKMWLRTEENSFDHVKPIEESDLLDLSQYSTANGDNEPKKDGTRVQNNNTDDNLTVEDIRGAVGNSGAIPGFSSSEAVKSKPATESSEAAQTVENSLTSESQEDVKKPNESSTIGSQPVSESGQHKDAEGDVSMQ